MFTLENLNILKEIVTICATCVAACVALSGLHTWKNQIKGRDHYDLAKKLLFHTYKYKEAVFALRHRTFTAGEYPKLDPQDIHRSEDARRYSNMLHAYERRWERVEEIKPHIYEAILESQVIWGDDLRDIYDKIFKIENELRLEISLFLKEIEPESFGKYEPNKKYITDTFNDDDIFRQKFNPLLVKIENYIKPKLKSLK